MDEYQLPPIAPEVPTETAVTGQLDIAAVGKRVKEIYPDGVSKSGRRYADMSDQEIGSKYVLANGDKGLVALGMGKAGADTKASASLRKEFNQLPEIKDFKSAQDSYKRASGSPNDGSGDLTLIYSYIKALDPNSVVREGEIDISKATASVPENIVTAYKRVKEGKLLSDQQRQEYKGEVARIYNDRAKVAKEQKAFYTGLANDMGADAESVVGGIEPEPAPVTDLPAINTQKNPSSLSRGIVGAGDAITDFFVGENKKFIPEFVSGKTQEDLYRRQQERGQGVKKGDVIGAMGAAAGDTADLFGTVGLPAIEAGGLVGSAKPAFNMVKSGVSKLPAIGNFVKNPKAFVGAARDKAAVETVKKGTSINLQKAISAGDDYVKNNPLAKGTWDKIRPTLGNKASVPQVLKKLEDIGPSAFSKGGDVKQTAQGALLKGVYGNLRNQLGTVAPEVAKQQSRLALINKGQNMAAKAFNPSMLGAVAGGALLSTVISKMMR